MTQLTRPALCRVEATVLPLREKMKTHGLADLLELNDRKAEAAILTLGVLAGLEERGEKLRCPLFGRALRWESADAAGLPAALGRVRALREKGPVVLSGGAGPGGPGKRVSELPGMTSLTSPASGWGETLPAHGVRAGSALVLCSIGGPNGGATGGRAVVIGDRSVDLIEEPPALLFGHEVAGAAALGYRRFPDLLTVELLRPARSRIEREVVPAADVDCLNGAVAALEVNGNQFRVAVTSASGDEPRLFVWRAAGLTAEWWRLRIMDPGTFLVWNAKGALYLLGRRGGWLLSPVSGVGRYRRRDAPVREFQGVVSLVRAGKGRWAALSAHGHLLSVFAAGPPSGPGEPPLEVMKEAVLPFAAVGLVEGGRGTVLAADSKTLFTLGVTDLLTRHVLAVARGSAGALVAGGGYTLTGERGRSFHLPGTEGDEPAPKAFLREALRAADKLADRGGEPVPVVDRHGRPPSRANWGV